MNRTLLKSLTVYLALGLIFSGCREEQKENFAGTGIIEATEIVIGSQSTGEILALNVEEGDNVSAGDTLAVIDVETIKLQRNAAAADLSDLDWNSRVFEKQIVTAKESIAQASITLGNAETTYNRVKNLFGQNAATKDRLDRAETEYSLAVSRQKAAEDQLAEIRTRMNSLAAKHEKIEANLRLFDNQITDSIILAPSEGSVIEKYSEMGEIAGYGKPIVKIADVSKVWLKIFISEEMIGKIKLGGKADIRIDSMPEKSFNGTIAWISPKAEFTPK